MVELYLSLLFLLVLDILLHPKLVFRVLVSVLLQEQQLILMVKMLVGLLVLPLLIEVLTTFRVLHLLI